jgi:hypothetical protein
MKSENWTQKGWPAVPIFLVVVIMPVLTALITSLPVAWLVNHIFAASAIRVIFGVEHLGYWRVVGLFAIVFAIRLRINVHGSPE